MHRTGYGLFSVAIFFGLLFCVGTPQTFATGATITLVKQVVNDDGGLATPEQWGLFLTDGVSLFEDGFGPTLERQVSPGTYYFHIAEDGVEAPVGYTPSPIVCDGGVYTPSLEQIDVSDGEHVTCTSASNDIAPTLRLVKNVVGGGATPHEWQLTATGERGFTDTGDSSASHIVKANIKYTLSENGPANYAPTSNWDCDRGLVQGDAVTLDVAINTTCTIINIYTPPQTPDPVIIIPGILGSWQKDTNWIIDPVLHTYDNLIDTLVANGYATGTTLFPFPYDWERSNTLTAFELKEKIGEIKSICNCNRVDIVAHSMGGLIARQYVESNYYQNDVDQLIFLATPHLGATYAYKTWEGAEIDFGPFPYSVIGQRIVANEARDSGYSNVFSFIRNKPVSSVQELLPIFDYLAPIPQNLLLPYPNLYSRNTFLENLNSSANLILLNTRGVRIYNVVGNTGINTPTSYSITASSELPKWEHGKPIATQLGPGDGTVPKLSAEFLGVNKQLSSGHNPLASTSAAYVFETLTGRETTKIVGKDYEKIDADLHLLFIKLLSPIDMQIIAPDGKRLGKNFDNNTELNEIPNAFYSGFNTDNEYAMIVNPLPGEYKVKTVGTGSGGHYTVVADYIDTQGFVETETSGTTTPAQVIENSLTLSTTARTVQIKAPVQDPSVSCVADMARAYKNKWITKKTVYDFLVFDCKALGNLSKKRATLLTDLKKNKLQLAANALEIKLVLAGMELLAKDKGNTKEGVLLILQNTKWFKDQNLK